MSLHHLYRVAILLSAVFCLPAGAQTYLHHKINPVTALQPAPGPYVHGELAKDAMDSDTFHNVYSAGYRTGGTAGHSAMGIVWNETSGVSTTFVSPEPDSVYTGIAVAPAGNFVFTVGTRNVSVGFFNELFIERWSKTGTTSGTTVTGPWTLTRTAVWRAGFLPLGMGQGFTYGGEIVFNSITSLTVSGCWTDGNTTGGVNSKIFAMRFNTTALTITPAAVSVSVVAGPGVLGGIDGHLFAWGKDIFRWHPRAFLEVMSNGQFYLGGTMNGDIRLNRFVSATGAAAGGFGGMKTGVSASPDLMTALAGDPNLGVCVVGTVLFSGGGWFQSWKANGTPVPNGPGFPFFSASSRAYDVKMRPDSSSPTIARVYVGGMDSAGDGGIWRLDNAFGSYNFTSVGKYYHAFSGAPKYTEPVYGLALQPTAPYNIYGTGEQQYTGGTAAEIVAKIPSAWPGGPSAGLTSSATPPLHPLPGPNRFVTGHTIQFNRIGPPTLLFSHGNGTFQIGTGYQDDAEMMSFTP